MLPANSQQDAGTATTPATPADPSTDTSGQAQDAPPAAATETGAAATPALTVEELTKLLASEKAHNSRLNEESKTRREKLETFEAAEAERKRADMSEIEKLTADLEAASGSKAALEEANGRLEKLDAVVTKQVEATAKRLNVPTHVMALLSEKTAVEQLDYLTEHAEQFAKQDVPDFDGSKGGKTKGGLQMDETERVETANALGVNPEFFK